MVMKKLNKLDGLLNKKYLSDKTKTVIYLSKANLGFII